MTDIGFAIKCPLCNEKKKKKTEYIVYSKQVLHLTSTPPLNKIRAADILAYGRKKPPVATSEQL